VSALIKKAVGVAKASGVPNKEKKGTLTMDQVREIARQKLPDLNADSIESACQMVMGTARSMGIDIKEK
jgi:large subunit ribosomal protein L11